jgi:DNA-binding NtrC family response regulator
MSIFTVLIVDDESDMLRAMKRHFKKHPFRTLFAKDGIDALDCLSKRHVDLVLLDLNLPGMNGFAILDDALNRWPELKVIILTGYGGIREAVAAIQRGAIDFFEKSTSPDLLSKKISQVYETWKLEQENIRLHHKLDGQFNFNPLIGDSPPMIELKKMIVRIAPTDTSILIQGENGTGKELVAKAIHYHSLRKSEAFIPVDCAAMSESVMNSELFGHSKGAFTGADQTTVGLVRSADKGTIFFDEIGELSLNMQATLLRTIQERVVRPVGSTQIIPVNFRMIAATNCNLIEAISQGDFRQDLYYRLSPVTLHVPQLWKRGDDITLLSQYLVKIFSAKGISPKKISESALMLLKNYRWPGNVRELENVIQSTLAFAKTDTIMPDDLLTFSTQIAATTKEKNSISAYEKTAICSALEQTAGNRRKAAKLLGISEATLYRRIKNRSFRDKPRSQL